LFTVEFFHSLRARAAPGAVVCVWVPLYMLTPDDARMVFRTIREVFPHATLWQAAEHDALVIAPVDGELTLPFQRLADTRPDLARIGLPDWRALTGRLLMDERHLERFTEGAPLNTDDRPLLEFQVPFRSRQETAVGVVQRAIRDYYERAPQPAGFEIAFDPPDAVFDAMGLRRASRVTFAGLARSFTSSADRGDITLIEHTVTLARLEAAGTTAMIRAHPRGLMSQRELWDTIKAHGASDAAALTIHGHDALLATAPSADGWQALFTWYCPETGQQYVGAIGPLGASATAADVERLGLECIHTSP
jgi:hypothetical protein